MKKIIAILAAVMAVFLLSACGTQTSTIRQPNLTTSDDRRLFDVAFDIVVRNMTIDMRNSACSGYRAYPDVTVDSFFQGALATNPDMAKRIQRSWVEERLTGLCY